MATEEQTAYSTALFLHSAGGRRAGQRLTITNRTITKLSFPLNKSGSPTGEITFTIRKVSDDSIIASKVWGDAGSVTGTITWYEVTLDTPVLVNEEVRTQVEFSGGDASNYLRYAYQGTNVKANEVLTLYSTSYTDYSSYDGAYIYTYETAGESLEKSLFDTLTISDSIVKAPSLNKADTVAIADTLSQAVGLIKADTITIADTIAKAVSLIKTDTVTIIDAFTKAVSYVLSLVDSVAITDSISKAISIVKTDAVIIADTMTAIVGAIHHAINLFDTVVITDSISKLISISKADVVTIIDTISTISITYLKQVIAKMQIKGLDIARMSINKMGIARMPLFRWIIRRWTA